MYIVYEEFVICVGISVEWTKTDFLKISTCIPEQRGLRNKYLLTYRRVVTLYSYLLGENKAEQRHDDQAEHIIFLDES